MTDLFKLSLTRCILYYRPLIAVPNSLELDSFLYFWNQDLAFLVIAVLREKILKEQELSLTRCILYYRPLIAVPNSLELDSFLYFWNQDLAFLVIVVLREKILKEQELSLTRCILYYHPLIAVPNSLELDSFLYFWNQDLAFLVIAVLREKILKEQELSLTRCILYYRPLIAVPNSLELDSFLYFWNQDLAFLVIAVLREKILKEHKISAREDCLCSGVAGFWDVPIQLFFYTGNITLIWLFISFWHYIAIFVLMCRYTLNSIMSKRLSGPTATFSTMLKNCCLWSMSIWLTLPWRKFFAWFAIQFWQDSVAFVCLPALWITWNFCPLAAFVRMYSLQKTLLFLSHRWLSAPADSSQSCFSASLVEFVRVPACFLMKSLKPFNCLTTILMWSTGL